MVTRLACSDFYRHVVPAYSWSLRQVTLHNQIFNYSRLAQWVYCMFSFRFMFTQRALLDKIHVNVHEYNTIRAAMETGICVTALLCR